MLSGISRHQTPLAVPSECHPFIDQEMGFQVHKVVSTIYLRDLCFFNTIPVAFSLAVTLISCLNISHLASIYVDHSGFLHFAEFLAQGLEKTDGMVKN